MVLGFLGTRPLPVRSSTAYPTEIKVFTGEHVVTSVCTRVPVDANQHCSQHNRVSGLEALGPAAKEPS
jgi:hypothetical protein